MDVKIITFHRALNYGAVLQCFALQKAIGNLGADASVYDYCNPKISDNYKILKLNGSIINNIFQIVTAPIKVKKKNAFNNFIKENIPLSSSFKDSDIFITGSDQVWNWRASDFDKHYFLDFVGKSENKNSYAASFGLSDIEESYVSEYKNLLSDFTNISVREKTGQQLLSKICGRESTLLPDPIFLLLRSDWKSLLNENSRNKKGFILLYLMAKTQSAINFAKRLSQTTGLKVVFIDNYEIKNMRSFKVKRGIGPKEWLDLFWNCEYVVTNSFHGTSFSILFNKKMYVELLPESYGVNSRLKDILQQYGLEDRIINPAKADNISDSINWSSINDKISENRAEGLSYLKKVIFGDK